MKYKIFIILFVLKFPINIFSQVNKLDIYYEKYRDATNLGSLGYLDTMKIEKIIDSILMLKFPKIKVSDICFIQGDRFYRKNNLKLAKLKYREALTSLNLETSNYESLGNIYLLSYYSTLTDVPRFATFALKSDILLRLSQIAMKEQDFSLTRAYLDSLTNKYFPHTGCGNGDRMNELILSIYQKNYFLAIKDTSSIIKLGLKLLIHEPFSSLAIQNALETKKWLLLSNSKEEIIKETSKSINEIKEESTGGIIKNSFTLFGYPVGDQLILSSFGKSEFKNYLYKCPTIKIFLNSND